MTSHLLKHAYHVAVYTIGICVLLLAVVATGIRLLLPDIGMYRGEIEAWVSNFMDLPVAIRSIEAEWQGWTPRLYLTDIDLLSNTSSSPIVNFNNAHININLLSTLLNRRIVPSQLTISGFDISVIREEDGSIDIEGIRVENYSDQVIRNDELADWLFSQNLIDLQNINIVWIDEKHSQDPVHLTNANLRLRSDGNRLQIEGSTSLPEDYGESMHFAIDATGDILTSDWTAEVFMHGNMIKPDNWYRGYWPADITVSGGSATTSIWSSWRNARLISLEGGLEYNDFAVMPDYASSLRVEHLNYRFSARETADMNWHFNVHIEDMITDNGHWPGTDLSMLVEPLQESAGYRYSGSFSFIKLDDLMPVIQGISFLPSEMKSLLQAYSLSGELYDGNLYVNPAISGGDSIRFNIYFDRLTVQRGGQILPVYGLSGHGSGSIGQGILVFDQDSAVLNTTPANQGRMVTLDGMLAWTSEQGYYRVNMAEVRLDNADFSAVLAGGLDFTGSSPYLDLVVGIKNINYEQALQYIPDIPAFRIRDWMERSIHGGTLHSIDAVLRGHVDDFPFDNREGQFKVIAVVSDADLRYSINWPGITEIDADVIFAGRKLTIDIHSGNVFNSFIRNATASIPDLSIPQKRINIHGNIAGDTLSLTQFVQKSPLKTHLMLEKVSSYLAGDGQTDLGLDLSIPLNTPGAETVIDGRLNLAGANLASDIDNLEFSNIYGDISFTRHSVAASGVSADFNGHAVELSIGNNSTMVSNPVMVTISGSADQEFIAEQVDRFFPNLSHLNTGLAEKLIGTTHWQASLTYLPVQGGQKLERLLDINSDLYGMTVNLPAPFNKNRYLHTPVSISKNLDNPGSSLHISYGNVLTSELEFDQAEAQAFKKITMKFGDVTPRYPTLDGLFIYGRISAFPVDEWLKLLRSNDTAIDDNLSLPVMADLDISSLSYIGQRFTDTTVIASNTNNVWQMQLDGTSVKGDIRLPRDDDAKVTIAAELDYLYLDRTVGGGHGEVSPVDFPSISANVASFNYADMDFGSLEFSAISSDTGLILNNILFTKPSLTVRASGRWIDHADSGSLSDFSIQAHATEFSKMLEPFGYNMAGINRGETHLSIDARWQGTPMDFSLDRLNGALAMQIGQGQMLDIEPAAGRLFGLLSLQALPRRLLFDFSDLLGKGMAFDRIEGSFLIENGNAYTEDLVMKGPSLDILITGRAGLSVKDYDQKAIVTPQISDSLAVATGFLGPVGIGVGTVLYLAGNMFEPLQDSINRLLKYEYSITGSWDSPVIEKYRLIQEDNNG